eukprot:Awhi_evm1s15494
MLTLSWVIASVLALQFSSSFDLDNQCYKVIDSNSQYKGRYVLAKYYNGKSDPERKGTYCYRKGDKCGTYNNLTDCKAKYKELYGKFDRNNKEIFTKACSKSDQKRGWCRAVQKKERRSSTNSRSTAKPLTTSKAPTCGQFFAKNGKNYCTTNGYANRRGSSTRCGKKGDNASTCGKSNDTCCKNYWETCSDFFASVGEGYCSKNGYAHRRSSSTDCKAGSKSRGCGRAFVCCKN